MNKNMLVIAAHPDDAEFTSGGSLARWISEGWAVSLIICSDGGKGSQSSEDDPAVLTKTRQTEQEASSHLLGICEVIWLGYPDGQLSQVAIQLEEQLTYLIRKYRPDRLLAWDAWRPYQLHPDHRTAGQAAMDAILSAGNPHFYPEQLQLTPGLQPHRWERFTCSGQTSRMNGWISQPPLSGRWPLSNAIGVRLSHCVTWRYR